MEYLAIFNIAFFASLSHCIGMCGGIPLVLNSKASNSNQNLISANLLYNFGRLSSYCLIGSVCGGIGVSLKITPMLKASVFVGIGILISAIAISLLLVPKFLGFFEPNLQKNGVFMNLFRGFFLSTSYKSFYFLGILNGLIPCGIVYYFALVALATGSVGGGAMVMLIFGLCTFLPMLLVGFFSGMILGIKAYQKRIHMISTFLMLLFGLYTLFKGIKGLL